MKNFDHRPIQNPKPTWKHNILALFWAVAPATPKLLIVLLPAINEDPGIKRLSAESDNVVDDDKAEHSAADDDMMTPADDDDAR